MHQLQLIPSGETHQRIARFQAQLRQQQIDGALVAQHIDLLYLTGTMQNGLLYVPAEGEAMLFIKKSVARAQHETPIPVIDWPGLRSIGEQIRAKSGQITRIGLEMDVLPYQQAVRFLALFPQAEATDISFTLRLIRAVKSDYELAHIRMAALKVNQVFESLPTLIRPGITEIELVAAIEQALRLQGNLNLYRMRGFNRELSLGMVVSGAAAAVPTSFDGPAGGVGLSVASPQGASSKKIDINEPILVDIGTVCEGYLIDQTRLAVIGELDADLIEAYQVACRILRSVEQFAGPGVSWEAVYQEAFRIVQQAGLQAHFMGYGRDQAKFLGHGIGLELDELPILANGFTQPLEKGMVIAIEPKFTFPGRGVIGLENSYVVTDTGLELLSLSNEEMIQIEI